MLLIVSLVSLTVAIGRGHATAAAHGSIMNSTGSAATLGLLVPDSASAWTSVTTLSVPSNSVPNRVKSFTSETTTSFPMAATSLATYGQGVPAMSLAVPPDSSSTLVTFKGQYRDCNDNGEQWMASYVLTSFCLGSDGMRPAPSGNAGDRQIGYSTMPVVGLPDLTTMITVIPVTTTDITLTAGSTAARVQPTSSNELTAPIIISPLPSGGSSIISTVFGTVSSNLVDSSTVSRATTNPLNTAKPAALSAQTLVVSNSAVISEAAVFNEATIVSSPAFTTTSTPFSSSALTTSPATFSDPAVIPAASPTIQYLPTASPWVPIPPTWATQHTALVVTSSTSNDMPTPPATLPNTLGLEQCIQQPGGVHADNSAHLGCGAILSHVMSCYNQAAPWTNPYNTEQSKLYQSCLCGTNLTLFFAEDGVFWRNFTSCETCLYTTGNVSFNWLSPQQLRIQNFCRTQEPLAYIFLTKLQGWLSTLYKGASLPEPPLSGDITDVTSLASLFTTQPPLANLAYGSSAPWDGSLRGVTPAMTTYTTTYAPSPIKSPNVLAMATVTSIISWVPASGDGTLSYDPTAAFSSAASLASDALSSAFAGMASSMISDIPEQGGQGGRCQGRGPCGTMASSSANSGSSGAFEHLHLHLSLAVMTAIWLFVILL